MTGSDETPLLNGAESHSEPQPADTNRRRLCAFPPGKNRRVRVRRAEQGEDQQEEPEEEVSKPSR